MNAFNKFNLPMTLVVGLLGWAYLSLFSVILGSLF